MIVTISKLDFVHERAVERTFSNQRSIEKSIPAFIPKLIPIFEALTFINSSESFLFLEPTLLRSQEYLSLNRISHLGYCSKGDCWSLRLSLERREISLSLSSWSDWYGVNPSRSLPDFDDIIDI